MLYNGQSYHFEAISTRPLNGMECITFTCGIDSVFTLILICLCVATCIHINNKTNT